MAFTRSGVRSPLSPPPKQPRKRLLSFSGRVDVIRAGGGRQIAARDLLRAAPPANLHPVRAILAMLVASACAVPRTEAITPPNVAPFDPSRSDPAALALADAEMAALGGHDRWVGLQELRFAITYAASGVAQPTVVHRWDRWNGRHQLLIDNP